MSKIKVLLLLPGLRRCGPVLGCVALAKNIDQNACEIIVGCMDKSRTSYCGVEAELKESGIPIEWLNMPGWLGLLKIKKVMNFIKRKGINLVCSYGLRPDLVNVFVRRHCVTVSSVRGLIRKEYRVKYGWVIATVFSSLHIWALKKMTSIIAMTDDMKESLKKEGIQGRKLACIHNFVDFNDINRHVDYNEVKTPKKKIKNDINIGFIGNFNRIKRIEWIVKGFGEIIKENPKMPLILHLAGDGPLKRRILRTAIQENLGRHMIYHGRLENVYALMKKLDLVILSSHFEGTPRVLMEAMSLGKTCIGPDIPGVNGLIVDNVTGYLFNPNSYENFASRLRQILINMSLLDPTVITDHIRSNFDAKIGARKTLTLFQRIISPDRIKLTVDELQRS